MDSRLPVYATPVVVGGRLRGYAWCGMQLSTPQFRGVLHKPRICIVPDPFLVKAVWLRETILSLATPQSSCVGQAYRSGKVHDNLKEIPIMYLSIEEHN